MIYKNPSRPETSFLPFVEVDRSPSPANVFVGSPHLKFLNSRLFAGYERFDDQTSAGGQDLVLLKYSDDKGATFTASNFEGTALGGSTDGPCFPFQFEYGGDLYMAEYGPHWFKATPNTLRFRKSTDNGANWGAPVDVLDSPSGSRGWSTNPATPLFKDGFMFLCPHRTTASGGAFPTFYELDILKCDLSLGIQNPAAWSASPSPAGVPESFDGFTGVGTLEGNWLTDSNGDVRIISRADNATSGPFLSDKAWLWDVDLSTLTPSNPTLIDFPGGNVEFEIKTCPTTGYHLAITSTNVEGIDVFDERLGLQLIYSKDGVTWQTVATFFEQLQEGEAGDLVDKVGVQYVSFDFDGADLIYLSRTAYDPSTHGGAASVPANEHDAILITFHRVENYLQFFNTL